LPYARFLHRILRPGSCGQKEGVKMEISAPPVAYEGGVVKQARKRLWAAPYVSLRDIDCEYRHGLLILRGQVKSYFEKQLAQESVARLEGVVRVVNEIEVSWDDSNE
jgi:osmotically-inducible protein OsmY